MKPFPAIALFCLLLAACAQAPRERPAFLGAQTSRPDPAAARVEVVITDIPPGHEVERVVLIDPQGARYAAEELSPTLREGGVAGPGAIFGIGVTGGSSSGIKPSLSLGLGTGLKEQTTRSRRVLARVPLPNPAAFQAEAARWRVETTYRDVTGERRTLVLPLAGPGR